MGKLDLKRMYFLFALSSLLLSCKRDNELLRNKIIFEDDVSDVANSIERMTYFMSKLPQKDIVNYLIDDKGFLYLNDSKFIYTVDSTISDKLRYDIIFDRFNEPEKEEFFYLLNHLKRNHISYAYRERLLGQIEFSYRAKSTETNGNIRSIIIDYSFTDTTSISFNQNYKVLDSKENLLLLGSK